MGREIRRVPADFDFPIGQTWHGFLNPHYCKLRKCSTCDGTGESPAYRLLHALWYGHLHGTARRMLDAGSILDIKIPLYDFAWRVLLLSPRGWGRNIEQCDVDALLEAGRLWDFTRTPRTDEQREIVRAKMAAGGNSWLPEDNGYRPTAEEVNAWGARGMGHGGINAWICIKARCAMYDVPTSCPAGCNNGNVPDPEVEALIEAWAKTPPPEGPAYQVWQTVSEGGPVSPPFLNPGDLADWMVANDNSITRATSRAQWLAFITGPGWAPSMLIDASGHIVSGVQAVTTNA